jgi:hypothetical protein
MISERDIYMAAKIVMKRYGEDAATQAAMRADVLGAENDIEGQREWMRIIKAIEELQAPTEARPDVIMPTTCPPRSSTMSVRVAATIASSSTINTRKGSPERLTSFRLSISRDDTRQSRGGMSGRQGRRRSENTRQILFATQVYSAG